MSILGLCRIEEVRRKFFVLAFDRIAVNVIVAEQTLRRGFLIASREADYHDVYMGFAPSI